MGEAAPAKNYQGIAREIGFSLQRRPSPLSQATHLCQAWEESSQMRVRSNSILRPRTLAPGTWEQDKAWCSCGPSGFLSHHHSSKAEHWFSLRMGTGYRRKSTEPCQLLRYWHSRLEPNRASCGILLVSLITWQNRVVSAHPIKFELVAITILGVVKLEINSFPDFEVSIYCFWFLKFQFIAFCFWSKTFQF